MANSHLQVDIAVLGGGPAGYVAAIRAAQLGASVALVEEREIGGTCLNRGCIPTKAFLKTAELALELKKSKEFGIEANVGAVHWNTAKSRKDRVVKSLRLGLEHLMAQNKVQIVRGTGTVQSAGQLLVQNGNEQTIVNCRKLIIATGSAPAVPPVPGIDLPNVINSDGALELDEVPAGVVIMGAGAIGLEFATMFSAAGAKVTVVEQLPHILPPEDREITAELLKIMKRQGIAFKLAARVTEIKEAGTGLEVIVEEKGQIQPLQTDMVLVATGRKLRNASPDIVDLGVQVEKGAIVVNEQMETCVPGVYAAGDAIGGKLLAHLAFAEGRVAAQNALGYASRLDYRTVPSCVYTTPEIASVGWNEEECRSRGLEVQIGRFDFRNNGRALCLGARDGFVKVIVDKNTHVILGAQILGAQAAEMISEITLAITLGAKAEVLAEMIHPHPTLGEALMEACGDAVGRAIHK